jgi:peptide/nickel transport system substrate-binding protein
MKTWRAVVLTALGATVSACGSDYGSGETAAGPQSFDAFCADVQPKVDAFISRMEQENPVAEDSKYGGTVVVGNYAEIAEGMNHFVSQDYNSAQHQAFVNMMTLVKYDPDLNPEPYLAESWEVDNPQAPTVLTFHLRPDVYWHDGVKTTAEDVAFTYVTATNPETAYPNAAFWDRYVRGPDGVEVVDSFTVRIKLQPHAEYMDPFRTMAVMPKHLLEGVPVTQLKQHPFGTQCPVGNGPFVFVEHRTGESWTFKANPAFPKALGGRPFLDRYVYRVVLEQNTLLADLLTENIDVYIQPRPDQNAQIKASAKHQLFVYPFRQFNYIGWNGRRDIVSDKRVRRALTLAVNRDDIVKSVVAGYGQVANSTVPPFHWAYDASVEDSLKYDPRAAERLLEQAGWTDRNGDGVRENAQGAPLEITLKYNTGNQTRQDMAEIFQAQLARVGVRVQPEVVEWATLLGQLTDRARPFDAVIMGWVTEFKVDDKDLFHSSRINEPYAYAGLNDPKVDRYLDTLQVIVDREQAKPVWREYQNYLLDALPYTLIYYPERTDGVSRRVNGVVIDIRGDWLNIKDWWVTKETVTQSQD